MNIERQAQKIALTAVFSALFLATLGCQSLNDSDKNKSCWYPSLTQPGHLNPAHEKHSPDESSDPFPCGTIGPRTLQARPQGWDVPRNWNTELGGSQNVKIVTSTASTP